LAEVADALGRKFAPYLGRHVRDEAEIRGPPGALPGRIIQTSGALKQNWSFSGRAGQGGADSRVAPAPALLEVLDRAK
jgi:ATP-dependent Lon protease